MLTEEEKQWLAQRKGYCNWCSVEFKTDSCFWIITADLCPLYPRQASTQDAAEFAERVAAKLAEKVFLPYDKRYPCAHGAPADGCMRDKSALAGPYAVHCEDCILKYARLAVEEEDAD